MKYTVYWNDKDFRDENSFTSKNLIECFLQLYGVREFVIYTKKFVIVGSNWLPNKTDYEYDIHFYFMIRAFLTEKQVIKFSKKLITSRFNFYSDQIKKCKKYDDMRLKINREDKSYNEAIKEYFNA